MAAPRKAPRLANPKLCAGRAFVDGEMRLWLEIAGRDAGAGAETGRGRDTAELANNGGATAEGAGRLILNPPGVASALPATVVVAIC